MPNLLTQVKIDECNCLIILKGGVRTEYTVGKGEVIAIDPGNITLNKGAEVGGNRKLLLQSGYIGCNTGMERN